MRKLSKRAALLASSAVLAVPGIVISAGAAHASTGVTSIRVFGSTHCLDNATENSSKVQMWNCTGHAEQNWSPVVNPASASPQFSFQNQNTHLCVTSPGSGGGTVTMSQCSGATTQQWIPLFTNTPDGSGSGSYTVWESASALGWCLNSDSVANGTVIRNWPCDTTQIRQEWHFDN